MTTTLALITFMPAVAAAGWALLVYLCGGGLGLSLFVFVVLKLLRK